MTLFPGSGLYQRKEKIVERRASLPAAGKALAGRKERRGKAPGTQPAWIVAGEIVQTSQLFARTVGRIDPQWVAELGAHLCKFSYSDPHWNTKAGRVLAWERVLIYGLEVLKRRIDYGKIDPALATELFIRGALLAGDASLEHHFFAHNRKLRERIEAALTRVRNRRVEDIEEALYRFYAARIERVSSVARSEPPGARTHHARAGVFVRDGRRPARRRRGGRRLRPQPVSRAGGGGQHGVAAYLRLRAGRGSGRRDRARAPAGGGQLTTGQLQWMVPGLREEQIGVLLRALPKSIRRPLMPLDAKIRETAREFQPERGEFPRGIGRRS